MAMVNVNRENPDQFYRYKMPLIIAKVEGKGNGIKTVLVNMVEIGKALGRPASYPCKYFGMEMGAQTQMDVKIGRYIVNGAHDAPKLQDMLDGFIKKFVLCPECENPETVLHVQATKGGGKIQQGCKACGHRTVIDARHKLSTFIIKNPPNSSEDSSGKKDKKGGRKGKGGKRDKKGDSPTHTTSDGAAAENGDDEFIDETPSLKNGETGGDEEEWGEDVTEDAVKARIEDLSGHVTNLTLTSDLEKTVAERVDDFYKLVEGFKKTDSVGANVATIKAEAERLDLMDKAAGILGELLFTENMISEIKGYRIILLHFVVDNRKGQKYLLISVERLIGEVFPSLLSKIALILKAFYDSDILEEESILEWADKVPKKHVNSELAKQVREKAAPFVTWLRTAEEESSDEEVEVVYSEAQAGNTLLVQEEKKPQPQEVGVGDIDIDAI